MHDIEVEHQARPFFAAVAEEFQNTVGHRGIPSKGADLRAGTNKLWVNGDAAWAPALWRRDRFSLPPSATGGAPETIA